MPRRPPSPSALTNLRIAERTRFVGRREESEALRAALDDGAPLVSVVGPAGVGKTRLARRVAADLLPAYPGGVWACDLGAARTAEDVVAAVAQVLSVPLSAGRASDAAARLGDAIAGRGRTLLVLDGFERVVDHARETVGLWLDRAPAAQVLVTSIIRLGLEGETAFELPTLRPEDAVALYEDRARRSRGNLSSADPAPVEALVAQLDHLPLAIELAAARASVLSAGQLLSRIEARLDLLRGPRCGRHASLVEAIAFAWDLLSEAERWGLAQCAVFRGGFTIEAAEAVIDVSDLEGAPAVVDVLEGLRDKSFLHREDAHPDRFVLYEGVRDFAERALVASGGLEAAAARHRGWCLRFGEARAAEVAGTRGVAAARALAVERENLLAAHLRAVEAAPREAARLGLVLLTVVGRHGPPALVSDLADRTVETARCCGDDVLLAEALQARAVADLRQGRAAEAREDLDLGLETARRAGAAAAAAEGRLLAYSGRLRSFQGDVEEGRREIERAIAILRGLGDPHLEAEALNALGALEESAGRLAESAVLFQRALDLFRAAGDLRFQGSAVLNLGVVRSAQGRQHEALELFEEALALLERADDRATAADVLTDLGNEQLILGDLDAAEATLEKALALERTLGNRQFEALAMADLGVVAAERGHLPLARRRLRQALALFTAGEDRRFHAMVQPYFAAVEAALGRLEAARAGFAEARADLERLGDRGNLATLEMLEGFLDLAEARAAGARHRAKADAHLRSARRRLEAVPAAGLRASELEVARRLLEGAVSAGVPEAAEEASDGALTPDVDALVVGGNAEWFRLPGGAQVDLSRRRHLRLVMEALVAQRLAAPGRGLDPDRVFQAGWPGETVQRESATNRVYVAIRTLRGLGLEDVLKRHDDGYLLDPSTPLARAS